MGRLCSFFLFMLIFGLSMSCESDHDFEIESESKIIVNCVFHPDSLWKVEILKSPESLWDYTFKPIEEASVKLILDNKVIELEPMIFNRSAYYSSPIYKVPIDFTKSIILEICGDESIVSAESNIPPAPEFSWELDELNIEKKFSNANRKRFSYRVSGRISLKIDNSENGHLWYRINIRYRPNMVYGRSTQISINGKNNLITDRLGFTLEYPEAFETIRMTDGYLIDLSAYDFSSDELLLELNGGVDNILSDLDYFTIIVSSVTDDFIKYNRKVMDQFIATQDIFSEPVSIHGNIVGGLGIFSGINTVTDTVFINK